MIDLSGLSMDELRDLIARASAAYRAAEQQEAADDAARKQQIAAAVATLEALLGPVDASPGVGSIRAVRAYDQVDAANGAPAGTTMGEHAGLALSLAYTGLEQVTQTLLNVARVLATE